MINDTSEGLISLATRVNGYGADNSAKYTPNKLKEIFQAGVLLNPENIYCQRNLAEASFKLGLYNEALQTYKKVIELGAQSAHTYHQKGYCLERLGHPKEALDAYKKALEMDPKQAATYAMIGLCLAEKLEFTEGKQYLNYALGLALDQEQDDLALRIEEIMIPTLNKMRTTMRRQDSALTHS